MKVKAVVHEAEEGGYWAEVPAIPGCATQAESLPELMKNLQEAIYGLEKDWAAQLWGHHGVRSHCHIGRNPNVVHSIAGAAEIRAVAPL